jgi:hypothetical protein
MVRSFCCLNNRLFGEADIGLVMAYCIKFYTCIIYDTGYMPFRYDFASENPILMPLLLLRNQVPAIVSASLEGERK